MKKLVFVSFAMSVLGEISESAYGMFNAKNELQNADNSKLLTHEKLPENEREEGHQSESYNYQIGDLRAQVSRLTALVETSLANEERKNKEKDQSEVYNYQIGDLKAQISRLTALAETSLANEERKSKEKSQSEVYNYQIGNLGAQISRLATLVQDLNEKVMVLSEERESLIAGNVVKSQEIVDQKEEATSELEQQKLAQAEKSEESNADMVAVNKEKTSSDASAAVNVDAINVNNAKSYIEGVLTALLHVAGEEAVQERQQELSNLVKSNHEKRWRMGWRGQTDVSIVNGTVKFTYPNSQVLISGLDRIKNFLRDVQTQINDVRSCPDFASSSRENSVSEIIQKPDVFAAVNVSTVTVATAKSAIEEMLTELLNVAGKGVTEAAIQEFYNMVNPPREKRGKGWKSVWINSYNIKIANGAVRFEDPAASAFRLGVDRIKNFLKDVQTQINDAR